METCRAPLRRIAAATGWLTLAMVIGACSGPPAAPSVHAPATSAGPVAQTPPPAPLTVSDLTQVAQLTGEESINHTLSRFGIAGADLGHMFDMDGRLYMVFGDTFGCCIPGSGGPGDAQDWRSNTMAVIDDANPADGLTFAGMIEDRPGHASQLLGPGRDDNTLIPTNGIAIGERMYLHYMAVREWGNPGHWDLNQSGIAWSDDKGQTWHKDENAVWPGDSNFGQVAFTRKDGYVYLLGIPGGRFGSVQLARVPEADLLDAASYQYYTGAAATGGDQPAWSADRMAAVPIVPAPVGELSVLWNDALGQWILTYLNEDKAALVIRAADELWGPWSDESVLVSGKDYPQLYGAFLHPMLVEENGAVIYFTMSLWRPYNVFLMRARVAGTDAHAD